MNESKGLRIPKFNGDEDDYQNWKDQFEGLVECKDYDQVLTEDHGLPETANAPEQSEEQKQAVKMNKYVMAMYREAFRDSPILQDMIMNSKS